jgi:hypothetical protein
MNRPTDLYMRKPMPRFDSIDSIVDNAVSSALQRIVPRIQQHIAALAAEELDRRLARRASGKRGQIGGARRRIRRDITKWVADHNARRVPKFVIQATGLDTKKKIVAKFGENAAFEKGKPLPKAN